MARRFSPEFNQEARKIVKSFNQRVRRAEARGMKNLPQTTSMRELKARFTTDKDLKKELSYLRRMNTDKEALKRHFLGEGAITNWEFNYLKDNLKQVKTFTDVQLKMARARLADSPYDYGLRQEVLNLEQRREYLNRDLNKLTYSELKTFRKYTEQYKDAARRDINYFDKYLKTLDQIMKQSDIPDSIVAEFKNKINKMPPKVFIEMYRRHDIIGDLFDDLYQYLESMGKTKQNVENKLTPEERAGLEASERMFEEKFGTDNAARQQVIDRVEAVSEKLNVWEVEARAGLTKTKKQAKTSMTPEEQEMYDKFFGDI